MKYNLLLRIFALAVLISCSSATKEPWFSMEQKSIGVKASQVIFKTGDNITINDSLRTALDTDGSIDSLANTLFEKIIFGFSQSHTKNITYEQHAANADIVLTIDTVIVSRGFTINISRPGPIYKAKIYAVSSSENSEIGKYYEGNENFAEMFGGDKAFHKPEEQELNDPKKQKKVILAAVREALGKAYADFLGIKNYM